MLCQGSSLLCLSRHRPAAAAKATTCIVVRLLLGTRSDQIKDVSLILVLQIAQIEARLVLRLSILICLTRSSSIAIIMMKARPEAGTAAWGAPFVAET